MSNDKKERVSYFGILDFDIHWTFGFWHLALMRSYFAEFHFFDPNIPSFQYSLYPSHKAKT